MKTLLRTVGVLVLLCAVGAVTFYVRPLWWLNALTDVRFFFAGVHGRTVDTGMGRVYVFESDARKSTQPVPVVLIHGLDDRAEVWGPMVPLLLARGFHVIALDLPGFGRSDVPQNNDYTMAHQAEAVAATLHAMGVKQADVVGWSMGGFVAAGLVLNHPETVRRLVLMDSAGVGATATSVNGASFIPKTAEEARALLKVAFGKPVTVPDFVARDLARKLQRQRPMTEASFASIVDPKQWLESRFRQIRQPLLLVWGERDGMTPLEMAGRMQREQPAARLVVVRGCGHMGPVECVGTYARVGGEFLGTAATAFGGTEAIAEDRR